jgi:hypothetical protein
VVAAGGGAGEENRGQRDEFLFTDLAPFDP